MKKWIVVVVILFSVAAGFYFLVPHPILLNSSRMMYANRPAITRLLITGNEWSKWWPGTDKQGSTLTDSSFSFNGYTYTASIKGFNSVPIAIARHNKILANTSLLLIENNVDYSKVEWVGVMQKTINPFTWWHNKAESKQIEADMSKLLDKMQGFFGDSTKVYHMNIRRDRIVDSLLVTTDDTIKGYPGVTHIYTLLDKLKDYIAMYPAKITGPTMLYVSTSDSIYYQVKVAIPIDRKLPEKGKFVNKWMMSGAYTLVTDVKGDDSKVHQAFKTVETFARDHHLTLPVIPFYSLITDRRLEKDSTKWETRIVYPIRDL